LWSVAGPVKLSTPVLAVVCASSIGMLGDVPPEGVESARLDAVPVDDPGDESGGDDKEVVGMHDDGDDSCHCTLGGRIIYLLIFFFSS
jgi:hypothetical protein